jgi:hypothetical protein
VDGVDPASGGGAADEWANRYLGDFTGAPEVDLTSGTNPTVTVTNDTAGQVASAVWTSNAGDATPAVTQGAVTSFDTVSTTGLVMVGALASTLMTETSQQAPHIWAEWALLLGETPRAGTDYAVILRFAATPSFTFAAQACGPVIYSPNDGSPEANLIGNPATDDEKRYAAWFEQESTTASFAILGREESTPFRGATGSLITDFDSVGFIVRGGGSIIEAIAGESAGGLPPDPDDMFRIPGPFLGGSTTFPGRPYTTPAERVAIAFQQQLSDTYSATVTHVAVWSRGGRASP